MYNRLLSLVILLMVLRCSQQQQQSSNGKPNTVAGYKAHAALMIIAWMFFASIGIIVARYFKFMLPRRKFCGIDFWFLLHRPIMVAVTLLSIAAFILILWQLGWKWVRSDEPVEFTHSIFGIVTVLYSVIQPVIAVFRVDVDHKYRIVFNIVHRFIGVTIFVFSIVCMFLGTVMEYKFIGHNGWGIMLGWTLWLVILIVLLEFFSRKHRNYTESSIAYAEKKAPIEQVKKQKTILLIVHCGVSLVFTVALVAVICA